MPTRKRGAGVEREIERHLRDLPPDIPFQCLGLDAEHFYLIDGDGLFRTLPRDRAGHMLMLGICGGENQDWAFHHYARWREVKKGSKELERVPRSLQPERLGQDVGLLCSLKGPFNPVDSVRMQGAWRGTDGDLVLHCGDQLWIRGAFCPTGLRGAFAYPRMPRWLPPHGEKVGHEVGREVLADIQQWQLGRYIDAQLLLGWLGLSLLAGAMETRPNILLLGEHGVGKSGLLQRLKDYLAHRMLLTPDATPAGITQHIGLSNLGIGLDEKEAGDDPRRDAQLMAFLRTTYTGGQSLRGGQDHTGVQFSLRCPVIAAATREPPMESADRSRNICITVIAPPAQRGLRLAYDSRREALGTMLLRRLADRWKQLQLETLPAWDSFLRAIGYDGRGVDTLGTLLAIAWIMREDAAPTQSDADVIADQLHALHREETAERAASFDRFLQYLLGLSVDPMRKGEWRTLLELVKLAAGYGSTPEGELVVESDAVRRADSDEPAIVDARRQLSRLGIRIGKDADGERTFLIAYQSTELANMLRGTFWAGLPGRSSPWAKLLLRAPEARTVSSVRFASGVGRAVELKLGWVLRGIVGPKPEEEVVRWQQRVAAHDG
jgi:hypothetical protein